MSVDCKYIFLNVFFALDIFTICYLHKEVCVPKISWKKTNISKFGRLSKLAAVKRFPQLPMLVDFE